MNDEIYYTLEKLDALNIQNSLLKCRIFLEIAQFTWLNYKGESKFKLSSEEYIQKAQMFLVKHDCVNEADLNETQNFNKENDENNVSMSPLSSPKSNSNSSLVLSPTDNLQSSRRQASNRNGKLNRGKNVKCTKSPLVGSKKSSKSAFAGNSCSCITSKLITFQLDLYKMLAEYAKLRARNCQYVNKLVQSRMKIKGWIEKFVLLYSLTSLIRHYFHSETCYSDKISLLPNFLLYLYMYQLEKNKL